MSEEKSPKGEIVERLSRIAGRISHISKDQKNQGQGFKFRGIDQVLNAIHGPFSEEGVVLLPEVLSHQVHERPTKSGGIQYHHILSVKFTFSASDGSSISCVLPGESLDSGDKGASKAMSIALKQAMFQVLTLPVEEQSMEDPDRHSPEESAPARATEQQKSEIEEAIEILKESQPDILTLALNSVKADSINAISRENASILINNLNKKIKKLKANG